MNLREIHKTCIECEKVIFFFWRKVIKHLVLKYEHEFEEMILLGKEIHKTPSTVS